MKRPFDAPSALLPSSGGGGEGQNDEDFDLGEGTFHLTLALVKGMTVRRDRSARRPIPRRYLGSRSVPVGPRARVANR